MTGNLADALHETREFMGKLNITKPALLLDRKKTENNISYMTDKAKKNNVRFRPHFKTHQAAEIGSWFMQRGVSAITVSSIDMAIYFAENGWKDINIAFSVNSLEMEKLNMLAKKVSLGLLLESIEGLLLLKKDFAGKADIWIKFDAGYGRTGLKWTDSQDIAALARAVHETDNLEFKGLLSHFGNTYHTESPQQVRQIFSESVSRLNEVRKYLNENGIDSVEISVGDTPGCCIVENFEGADEIRPGNFVFYDLTAYTLGACTPEDISVCMACPVVAKHADRNAVVVHGGAVHFSKEYLEEDGKKVFGYATVIRDGKWQGVQLDTVLTSMSQEHGIITASDEFFENIRVGDVALILPVHSCLTADLMKKYHTLDGAVIDMGMFF